MLSYNSSKGRLKSLDASSGHTSITVERERLPLFLLESKCPKPHEGSFFVCHQCLLVCCHGNCSWWWPLLSGSLMKGGGGGGGGSPIHYNAGIITTAERRVSHHQELVGVCPCLYMCVWWQRVCSLCVSCDRSLCVCGLILSFKAGPFVDEKTSEGVIDGAVSDSVRWKDGESSLTTHTHTHTRYDWYIQTCDPLQLIVRLTVCNTRPIKSLE